MSKLLSLTKWGRGGFTPWEAALVAVQAPGKESRVCGGGLFFKENTAAFRWASICMAGFRLGTPGKQGTPGALSELRAFTILACSQPLARLIVSVFNITPRILSNIIL